MAARVLSINGDDAPLSQLWVSNFLKRNKRVHTIVGRSIEAVRAKAANLETIRAFMELFESTQLRLSILIKDT
jgi:hypothetical protein